jgi:hypothetical protein
MPAHTALISSGYFNCWISTAAGSIRSKIATTAREGRLPPCSQLARYRSFWTPVRIGKYAAGFAGPVPDYSGAESSHMALFAISIPGVWPSLASNSLSAAVPLRPARFPLRHRSWWYHGLLNSPNTSSFPVGRSPAVALTDTRGDDKFMKMAPSLSLATKQLICEMRKSGKSISDTARDAECSEQAVKYIRSNLPLFGTPENPPNCRGRGGRASLRQCSRLSANIFLTCQGRILTK